MGDKARCRLDPEHPVESVGLVGAGKVDQCPLSALPRLAQPIGGGGEAVGGAVQELDMGHDLPFCARAISPALLGPSATVIWPSRLLGEVEANPI